MMVTPLPTGQGLKAPVSPVKKTGGAMKPSTLQLQPSKTKDKQNLQHEALEFPLGAKSPIKKHLKNAAMTKWQSNPASPTQHTQPATSASPSKQTSCEQQADSHNHASLQCSENGDPAVMFGLLDQDQDTVQGTIPILQALASLPLENPSVRHECLQMLQKLYKSSFSPSKQRQYPLGHYPRFDAASDIPTSEGDGDNDSDRAGSVMSPSFVYKYDDIPSSSPPAVGKRGSRSTKDSGRAKSLSLYHCKEFLLACANEIHELEDENPNFDYAEDTSSETTSGGQRRHRKNNLSKRSTVTGTMLETLGSYINGNDKWRATDFDYASTAASSASTATEIALNDGLEDVQADQGSEFSEVVRRADYLSDFGDDDEIDGNGDHAAKQRAAQEIASVCDRVLCRQAMHQFQMTENSASPLASPKELLLLKHRVFTALKQNGLQSRRNASRKRLAFQFLKTNLQQMRLKRSTMKKLEVATSRSPGINSSNNSRFSTKKNTKTTQAPLVGPTTTTHMMAPLGNSTQMKILLNQHLDLVFVVLCALFMQSMLS